ncbi:MAG TPA: T9SS type A sorting domain-containing protein [Cryomorphaceae bacterium]|nr:T9SS type A sorting domain-containing protein [Cryomorphaceae bacterium]
MVRSFLIIAFFGFWSVVLGQSSTLIQPLNDAMSESSGLINIQGRFITHNDSGGESILYEIDTLSGEIARMVTVIGTENTDWEDLASDDTYIYIGDFGNNAGNRTDLRILRVAISDYIESSTNEVTAETIFFSYNDQVDFSDATFTTNFDAEAMIVNDGVIFIFTKNWGNQQTNIYELPAEPGTHSAIFISNFNSQGLTTGADYNQVNDQLVLLGHSIFLQPFVIDISYFDFGEFDIFIKTNVSIPAGYSGQAEGIAEINGVYYFTSEDSFTGAPGLFRLPATFTTNLNPQLSLRAPLIYPNPASSQLFIESENFERAEILDLSGKSLFSSKSPEINVSNLSQGFYVVAIWAGMAGEVDHIKFVVK